MGFAMSVKVDDARVLEVFAQAPEKVRTRIGQLVEGAAIDVQREMRVVAPVAVTGDLRKSVKYVYSAAALQAVIKPSIKYAERVELGGPPVRLSIKEGSPLRKWAELKGANPVRVRDAIAAHGTKPHPFVEPTYDKMKPKVERDISTGITKLVDELNR